MKDKDRLTVAQSMIFAVPRPAEEFYDIINDPYETNNLINDPAYADTVARLRDELEKWRKETNDFSPEQRRRNDNTDRFTGIKFDQTRLPPRPGGDEKKKEIYLISDPDF